MPTLNIVETAPQLNKLNSQQQEERRKYEEFITKVSTAGKIGDLKMSDGDRIPSVRMALSHASRRVGQPIQMWAVEDHLYFKTAEGKKLHRDN